MLMIKKEGNNIMVILQLTTVCNLNCSYCFEMQGGKTDSAKFMSKEDIDRILSESKTFKESGVVKIHGGEPLVAKDLIEYILDKPEVHKVFFNTNGLLINRDLVEKWHKYRDKLRYIISLDGCKASHNISRNNSFDKVYSAVKLLHEMRDNGFSELKSTGVSYTISPDTVDYVFESVIFFQNNGINIFTYEPASFTDFTKDQQNELFKQLGQAHEYLFDLLVNSPKEIDSNQLMCFLENCINKKSNFYPCTGYEGLYYDIDGNCHTCIFEDVSSSPEIECVHWAKWHPSYKYCLYCWCCTGHRRRKHPFMCAYSRFISSEIIKYFNKMTQLPEDDFYRIIETIMRGDPRPTPVLAQLIRNYCNY